MKKRIGAAALALVLALSLMCPALAAESAVFRIKPSVSSVKAGETFTVTVELEGNPGFNAIGFTLTFDNEKLTCTGAREGELMKGMLSVSNPSAKTGAIIGGASVETMTGDGTAGRFTFTALADLDTLSFSLTDVAFSDVEGKSIPYRVENADVQPPSGQDEPGGNPSGGGSGGGGGGTPSGGETPSDGGETPSGGGETPSGGGEVTPVPPPDQPAVTFPDTKGHWAESYIARAVELGLFKGYADGTFGPNDPVTRGQYVTVLYRMAGSPPVQERAPFTDIGNQLPEFQDAIAWGCEQGFLSGRSPEIFDPSGSVTRQEAMKILFGYDGGVSGLETMFTAVYDATFQDSGDLASWAKPGMYWGVYHSLISGVTSDTLAPRGTATRAQLAKILTEYYDMQSKEENK